MSAKADMQECLVFLQFANPDVAEADGRTGVAVALQKYRTCTMLYHTGKADVFGCTVDTCVVLQKHAVLEYCYIRIRTICTVFLENGNVIGEWMDVVSIYVCPVGAFIAAFIFYWIMGPRFAREQIGLGRDGRVPAWILPLGKYLYCGIALLVLALGIMLGGIG